MEGLDDEKIAFDLRDDVHVFDSFTNLVEISAREGMFLVETMSTVITDFTVDIADEGEAEHRLHSCENDATQIRTIIQRRQDLLQGLASTGQRCRP